jgi:hypothetical protein
LPGASFETCEPFTSLIFKFWGGHGKPQITETVDTESADTGEHLTPKEKQNLQPISI